MIVRCSSDRFLGLVNPYTGSEMEVMMLVRRTGEPLFFAPDTYSTSQRYSTAAEAIDAWDNKLGVAGVKPRDSLRCAYTGEQLRVVKDNMGYFLLGGFDPRRLQTGDEFEYNAKMLDGVSPVAPPEARKRITIVQEDMTPTVEQDDDPVEPSDEAIHEAEKVVSQFKDSLEIRQDRTTVHVDGKRKGRK